MELVAPTMASLGLEAKRQLPINFFVRVWGAPLLVLKVGFPLLTLPTMLPVLLLWLNRVTAVRIRLLRLPRTANTAMIALVSSDGALVLMENSCAAARQLMLMLMLIQITMPTVP